MADPRRCAAGYSARGFHDCEKPAINTATTPIRKMPSKVPAPPIEATGAPRPTDVAKIEQVRADQRAQAAADIGERRGLLARKQ